MELQYFTGKYITHTHEKEHKDIYFRFINCNGIMIHIKFNDYIYGSSSNDSKDTIITLQYNDISDWYMMPYASTFSYLFCRNIDDVDEPLKSIKYDGNDKINIVINFFSKIINNIWKDTDIIYSMLNKSDISIDIKYEINNKSIEYYKESYFLFRDRINALRRYLTYKTNKNKNINKHDYQLLLGVQKTNSEITLKLHHIDNILLTSTTTNDSDIIKNLKKISSCSNIRLKNKRFQQIMIDRIQLNSKHLDSLSCKLKEFPQDTNLQKLISIYESKSLTSNINKSLDLFMDVILMSDWCEELVNNNVMGLLVKMESLDLSKMGYNLRNILINEVTTTFISYQQLLNAYENFYCKHKRYDNGRINNSSTIHGGGIGNGNIIIPLYIHIVHWKLVNIYMNTILGVSFCQHPLSFTSAHIDIYFLLFSVMSNLTFCRNYHSEKWINIFINVYRTCYQILKDNKININKKIDTFCDMIENRITIEYQPLTCFYSQILCSDFIDYRIDEFMLYFIEESIRSCCKNIYKNVSILNYTFNFNSINDIEKYESLVESNDYFNIEEYLNNDQINNIINEFQREYNVQLFLGNMIGYYRFYKIIQKIISKYNGINSFIHTIDDNYGILSDEDIMYIQHESKLFDKVYNNIPVQGIIDDTFSHHSCESNYKIITFEYVFDICNVKYSNKILFALIVQGILQRNDKKRIIAIQNNKYKNPFKFTMEVIGKCGLIIAKNKRQILGAI